MPFTVGDIACGNHGYAVVLANQHAFEADRPISEIASDMIAVVSTQFQALPEKLSSFGRRSTQN